MIVEKILSDIPLSLHERALMRYLGSPAPEGLMERATVARLLKQFVPLMRARGIYAVLPFRAEKDRLLLPDQGLCLTSAFLVSRFGSSGNLGVFAVTAGDEADERYASLMAEGRIAEALVLYAAASAAVDQAARHVMQELQRYMGVRLVRYSPGFEQEKYGWHVREQQIIFELLVPERIGIRLTPRFTMKPEKSVSAVAGKPFRRDSGS